MMRTEAPISGASSIMSVWRYFLKLAIINEMKQQGLCYSMATGGQIRALSSQNLSSYYGSTVEPFLKQKRSKMVQVPQKWSRFENSAVLSEEVFFWFL